MVFKDCHLLQIQIITNAELAPTICMFAIFYKIWCYQTDKSACESQRLKSSWTGHPPCDRIMRHACQLLPLPRHWVWALLTHLGVLRQEDEALPPVSIDIDTIENVFSIRDALKKVKRMTSCKKGGRG